MKLAAEQENMNKLYVWAQVRDLRGDQVHLFIFAFRHAKSTYQPAALCAMVC